MTKRILELRAKFNAMPQRTQKRVIVAGIAVVLVTAALIAQVQLSG